MRRYANFYQILLLSKALFHILVQPPTHLSFCHLQVNCKSPFLAGTNQNNSLSEIRISIQSTQQNIKHLRMYVVYYKSLNKEYIKEMIS